MQDPTLKLLESAKDFLKAYGYFMEHLWHVDDVYFLCEQRGWPKLSHEEAISVFVIFSELYDGELGMTWVKLEQAVQVYLAQSGRIAQIAVVRSSSIHGIESLLEE